MFLCVRFQGSLLRNLNVLPLFDTYFLPFCTPHLFFLFLYFNSSLDNSLPPPLCAGRNIVQLLSRELELYNMLSLFNTAWHQPDCYRGFSLELLLFKYLCDHGSCSDPLCQQLSLPSLCHLCELWVKVCFTSVRSCKFNN